MTITYNASDLAMVDYIKSNLCCLDSSDIKWYTASDTEKTNRVNNKDLHILVGLIKQVIMNDFEKIRKLTKYLKNVATLLNLLELPIV